VLRQPLLYLSLYFKQHRSEYYRQLDAVRTAGDWEAWLDYFLEGVTETAAGAVDTAHRLLAMFESDAARIQGLGRVSASALRIFDALRRRPVTSIDHVARETGVAYTTAARAVDALVGLGILRELTGRRRGRVFAYDQYLETLSEGAEALGAARDQEGDVV
jgi:Fic family protein